MPPVPVPKPSIGGQAKQREIQREEELLSQIAEAKGPEAFFEYMKSQGMSDDDIQRMLSGDQQVMEEALARKVFVCPLWLGRCSCVPLRWLGRCSCVPLRCPPLCLAYLCVHLSHACGCPP